MSLKNVSTDKEIKLAIEGRKRKILLVMYSIVIFVFLTHNITDILHDSYKIIPIRLSILAFVVLAFFLFYRRKKYTEAAYSIFVVLAIATLAINIVSKLDNFTPAFFIPLTLGAFALFSWRKGILYSSICIAILFLAIYLYKDYFFTSQFLQNNVAIFNFIYIVLIVFIYAIYYETTRIETHDILLNANHKKELLYTEIHHRVKNNLNIVSSMLAIQAQKEDERVRSIINTSKDRIDALAMVHSMLYVSDDMEKVNAKDFIEKLSQNIHSSLEKSVKFVFKIQQLELSLNEIIPIGLIINELLTNSYKYAFYNIKNPKIIIVLCLHKEKIMLTYHDNGIGYNDNELKKGIGLKLIELNTRQLKGSLAVKNINGLQYKIAYKRKADV